jgi:hypothetical protein
VPRAHTYGSGVEPPSEVAPKKPKLVKDALVRRVDHPCRIVVAFSPTPSMLSDLEHNIGRLVPTRSGRRCGRASTSAYELRPNERQIYLTQLTELARLCLLCQLLLARPGTSMEPAMSRDRVGDRRSLRRDHRELAAMRPICGLACPCVFLSVLGEWIAPGLIIGTMSQAVDRWLALALGAATGAV